MWFCEFQWNWIRHFLKNFQGNLMFKNFCFNFFSYLVKDWIMIPGQILIKHKKVNGSKILKNAYILIELTKLLIFMTLIWKTSQFSKIEIFGSLTKNSDFSDFSGILLLFSTKNSWSGTDIPIPIIINLFGLGKCFTTIYEQIL